MGEQSKRKMKFGRLVVICGLALGILFGAAVLIVPRCIPWDKLKDQTVEKLSSVLHHQVSIGKIGFQLFKGIEVRDVKIANASGFSPEPFLQDDAVIVQYRLLPLLFGKVAIKAIVLNNPHVLIEKKADGTYNFSDMLPAKKPKATTQTKASASLPAIPLELLISRISISGGLLVYRDLAKAQDYRVESFNLLIDNLTLAGITPVKITLDAKLRALGGMFPLQMATEWRFNYSQQEFKLDMFRATLPGVQFEAAGEIVNAVSAPELNLFGKTGVDVAALLEQLPQAVKKKIPNEVSAKGTVALSFTVNGPIRSLEQLEVKVANQINLNMGVKELTGPLAVTGQVNLKNLNCQIKQNVILPGTKVDISANVQDLFQTQQVSATLSGTIGLTEALAKCLPPDKMKQLAAVQLDGSISLVADIQGFISKPAELSFSSQIKLRDVGVTYQNKVLLQHLVADLTLTPQQFVLKEVAADLAGKPLAASLKAEGFDLRQPETMKPDKLKATVVWDLRSQLLDVDALLALMPQKAGTVKAVVAEAPVTLSDLPEPDARTFLPEGLVVQGKAALGGLKFGQLELGRMEYTVDVKKKTLTAAGSVRGYQGQIQNTTQLDFTESLLSYRVKADVTQVDVEPLLNDIVDTFVAAKLKKPQIIAEIKDKFTGRLSGNLALTGKGMRTTHAKPNLMGKGSFVMKAGRIRQFSFQEDLAKWFGSEKFRQDIPFDHTSLEFQLEKQVVNVSKFIAESGLQGQSGDIRLTAEGKVTFAAEFDGFKLRPRLNPRASTTLSSEFGNYSEMLKDDQGWVTVPVILNGPIKKPDVKPDWDWIKGQSGTYVKRKTEAMGKEVGKKANKFVEEQQGKSTKEIQENVSQELEKAKEKIKQLDLKKLFE